jgi:hypothetical protein
MARKALVGRLKILENGDAENVFGFSSDKSGKLSLFHNGEQFPYEASRKVLLFKYFNTLLRLSVAEYAPKSVFVHAGVVGWKGTGMIFPANSFAGKTTLVAELVKNGATYFSDEYAVLDENGLVHPFPRDLSVRGEAFEVREVSAKELGGITGTEPLPVGSVIITEFKDDGRWEPIKLSVGQGILEMIPHTIPRNFNTKFSLKVLNTAVSDAIILKSPRGEARDLALNLLSFFDNFNYVAKFT